MRTISALLAACALLASSTAVRAQQTAPHMFDDVPLGSPAYSDAQLLVDANVIRGYPRDYFARGRLRTRVHFAIALDGALVRGGSRQRGPSTFVLGPLPTAVCAAAMRRLAADFHSELRFLGESTDGILRALDLLGRDRHVPGTGPSAFVLREDAGPPFRQIGAAEVAWLDFARRR